jgi:hypothetical protein
LIEKLRGSGKAIESGKTSPALTSANERALKTARKEFGRILREFSP